MFVLFLLGTLVSANDIIVLQQGQLRGHQLKSRNGRDIFAYQGIPYVKPPIGDLRFMPPEAPESWIGIFNATKEGPNCLQRNFFNVNDGISGEEDCLYLNVYTPVAPNDDKSNLDVMLWIHGGGWVAGSGNSDQFGPHYLLDKDVVLVTINYRLGALGFLSTGDAACPGNNGMKDQVAALRWVRNNIAAFGGNPNSVTLFGESAGGASVHYHMLSPVSKGLFHRAISQSGTALLNWSLAPKKSTTHHTIKLASLLSCPTKSSNNLLVCMKSKSAKEIASTDKEFMEWDSDPMIPFNLVVEKQIKQDEEAFISVTAHEALRSGSIHLVPWMVGLTSGEGAVDVARIFRDSNLIEDLDSRFDDIISMAMFFRETTEPEIAKNITQQIRNYYFEEHHINSDSALRLRDMFTDAYILSGTDEAVKIHSQKGSAPLYYYYFNYRGSNSHSSMFGDTEHDYGVCHEDDLMYLFPQDHLFPNSSRTVYDDKMVDIMTTLWTNFAHSGNPTPLNSNDYGLWLPVTTPSLPEYVNIDASGLQMDQGLLQEPATFWTSLFHKVS